jgi:single-strand DNA-binding protein
MGSVNKAFVIGNLGQDPDLKHFDNGRVMARFSVATSERWRDATSGQLQERTEWHRVVVWGKTAELVGEHLAKGRQVCVEGRLRTRKWQDAEGHDKYTTEIVADRVTFLGHKGGAVEAEPESEAA